jgi:site-specific DNA recombinase
MKVPVSTIHTILRNRLYTGWFEWNGKLIQGRHDPLISVQLWERVQGVLDGRFARRAKRGKHEFAFSGLIKCAQCGCAVVGEMKKLRYVYYHCTGYADKCLGNPASCRRRYVRQEVLEHKFSELLGRLHFDNEVLDWVREALHASHASKRREQEEVIARLRVEWDRLQKRIDAMYLDKLDGRVDAAFFDKMSAEWRAEQNRCQRQIDRHLEADKFYMDEGIQILELARNAQKLFDRQQPREKRRLLNLMLSNCSWEDGEVIATFRQPFDLLAQTTAIATRAATDSDSNSAKSNIWLGN